MNVKQIKISENTMISVFKFDSNHKHRERKLKSFLSAIKFGKLSKVFEILFGNV